MSPRRSILQQFHSSSQKQFDHIPYSSIDHIRIPHFMSTDSRRAFNGPSFLLIHVHCNVWFERERRDLPEEEYIHLGILHKARKTSLEGVNDLNSGS